MLADEVQSSGCLERMGEDLGDPGDFGCQGLADVTGVVRLQRSDRVDQPDRLRAPVVLNCCPDGHADPGTTPLSRRSDSRAGPPDRPEQRCQCSHLRPPRAHSHGPGERGGRANRYGDRLLAAPISTLCEPRRRAQTSSRTRCRTRHRAPDGSFCAPVGGDRLIADVVQIGAICVRPYLGPTLPTIARFCRVADVIWHRHSVTVSACRWATFHSPSSRRYTWVARKV
jgi:hypothetical protein